MPKLRVNKTLVTTLSDCVSRSAFLAAREINYTKDAAFTTLISCNSNKPPLEGYIDELTESAQRLSPSLKRHTPGNSSLSMMPKLLTRYSNVTEGYGISQFHD
ncbi:hypothetical protein J6590_084901 [Homalodisca vitripennis]|nr:hypothetical protein J6590_084901 [Homalodisca vitripennis]